MYLIHKASLRPLYFLTILAFSFSSILASNTRAEIQAEKKLALIIGNSSYQSATVLPNPRNDAIAVAEGLKKSGFTVIKLIDATKLQQKNAVRIFLEQFRDYQVGLFYYAGHGISVNGRNYLIPVDVDLHSQSDVEKDLLLVDDVLGVTLKDQQMLVFLDACRENPFVEQLAKIKNVNVSRGLAVNKRIKPESTGLSRLETGNQNLFVAFATQPGNVAMDGLPGEEHSPFSKGLLLHLNEKLEVREMMTKVRASVAQETNYMQIPWEQNSLLKPVYISGKPDLGKMQTFHIANVTKVNKSWGFVVADLVGDRRPEEGTMVKMKVGDNEIDAKVGKVMAHAISIIPSAWNKEISIGTQVIQEKFSEE